MRGLQALKAVKGILNKLTPEKFERLLTQLVDHVTNADILHGTITLVFENAVAQPTFVAMYSELCQKLSQVRSCSLLSIPPHRPQEGSSGGGVVLSAFSHSGVNPVLNFASCLEAKGHCSIWHLA